MGIIVEGCLADFKAHGCLGELVCRLAVRIMKADAFRYPTLPEKLQGMDAEDLGSEFILAMFEKDRAKDPSGKRTSWDEVLVKDGATDADLAARTRTMANNWLVDQFHTTQLGRDYEKLRNKLRRATKDGAPMFVHYGAPSAWGLAGGPSKPFHEERCREMRSAARRHTVTRMVSKGKRDGNLGRKGEVEALVLDVLTAAQGTIEQTPLFSLILDRVVGDVVVTDIRPVTDWAGGRVEEFGMDEALDRANKEDDGRRAHNGGLEEV